MNYLKPPEVVTALIEAGTRKAALPVRDLLVRGALSGAILGIATSLAITAAVQTSAISDLAPVRPPRPRGDGTFLAQVPSQSVTTLTFKAQRG